MPPAQASYIEVPAQVIPFYPNVAPSPEGVGVGGGVSLVQYNSISVTEQYPSDVARSALDHMSSGSDGSGFDHSGEYFNCYDFVEYLDKCEKKGFRLKGFDTVNGQSVNIPLSYENRWTPGRRKELAEKLKRLEFWFEMQEDRPVTMITLTSFQRKGIKDGKIWYAYNCSVKEAWRDLNRGRDSLRKLIHKYFGDVDYFWVAEPHKSGYVHYHMAVFADVSNNVKDNKGVGMEDKFRDLWSRKWKVGSHTYGLDFSQKKGDAKIQHLKNYLSKYLAKGFLLDKWTSGMLVFNANLWLTGYRLYGASTRIREFMNIEKGNQDNEIVYYWKESEGFDDLGEGYAELDSYRLGHDIVWLETKLEEPETTPDGEEIRTERIIWDRQYIPDWIDEPLWYGNGRQIPSDLEHSENRKEGMRLYQWGRGHRLPLIYEVKSHRQRDDDYKLG